MEVKDIACLEIVIDEDGYCDDSEFEKFYFENATIRDEVYKFLKDNVDIEVTCPDELYDLIREYAENKKTNYYTSQDDFIRPNKVNTIVFKF